MTDTLFPDLEPTPLVAAEPAEKISAGRRLTLRQRADIDKGRHPLTRMGLLDGEQTCGSCRFRVPGRFAKCHWRPGDVGGFPYVTGGPATDCRAWWPACTLWKAKP